MLCGSDAASFFATVASVTERPSRHVRMRYHSLYSLGQTVCAETARNTKLPISPAP